MLKFVTREVCPICNSGRTQPLVDKPLTGSSIAEYLERYYSGAVPIDELVGANYVLMHCQDCQSLYQKHILDDVGLEQLYEKWIQPEDSFCKKHTASLLTRNGYARQCIQLVKAIQLPPHEIKLLDFGMGWGMWLLMARAFGTQAEGVELSPKRREYALSNGLVVMSPDKIEAESYHFINAEQVFEHLADPIAALRDCWRWLKRDGILRIAVPNGNDIRHQIVQDKWDISAMPTIPLEHINTFTPSSLRYFGVQNGFTFIHPPFVLPALSLTSSDIRQWVGILGLDIGMRLKLVQTTTVWLRKREMG